MNMKLMTAFMATGIVAGMGTLGAYSEQLYRAFCQATGLGGTTQRSAAPAPGAVKSGRQVTVRFDANQSPTLPWTFKPEQRSETVTVGARDIAFYTAKNLSARPVTGRATFNVTPFQAGKYFTKIQCFCFTEQTLQPGQEVRMPVVFFVDPKIATEQDGVDISEITLSYTFYPVDEADKQS